MLAAVCPLHGFPVGEAVRLIHALRSTRESARVATRERDDARHFHRLATEHQEAAEVQLEAAEAQLTDRDRMIAGLRDALKIAMGAVHQLMDEHANAAAGADVPLTSVGTAMGDQAMRAAGSLVYDSHPIAAAFEARAGEMASAEIERLRERVHEEQTATELQRLCTKAAKEELRAHEETIGRLTAALRMSADRRHRADCDITTAFENPDAEHNTTACWEAKGALTAAPPGEYEQRVRRDVLERVERVIANAPDARTAAGTLILGAVSKDELLAAIRALASKEAPPT